MSARVLVTGATGFVGSHVAESLLADGHTVRLLIRDPRRLKWFKPDPFEIVIGDVTSEQSINEAVRDVEIVIHCAGVTKSAKTDEFFRVNDQAARSLARASERAMVKRFVLCSTLAVCGPSGSDRALTESDPELPITNYGRSKLAGERAVREELRSTEWVILRPPAVMGPRDEQFVPLYKMMFRWRIYTEIGSTKRLYSMIGVNDLVRGLKCAAFVESGMREIYFVALVNPYEWKNVAEAYAIVTGKTPSRVIVPEFVSRTIGFFGDLSMKLTGKPVLLGSEKVREILATGWACEVSKCQKQLSFRCQDSIEDVVRATHEFYIKQRWI
ncbi:MAG: NAD-dependent epimerase/dehydratase family protein [bacterium]|nr:NAD-dependent epimerase/dehydratase family protein [bacterium]